MWNRRSILAVLAAAALRAADAPPSADSMLDAAKARARDGRAIFANFHASW